MSTWVSKVPAAAWVAVVAAVAGFFVHAHTVTVVRQNGAVVSCSYTDYLTLIAALIAVCAAVSVYFSNRKAHPKRRLPTWAVAAFIAVIGIVAVILVLRGVGVIETVCATV